MYLLAKKLQVLCLIAKNMNERDRRSKEMGACQHENKNDFYLKYIIEYR